jgi:hypothetical protein
MKEEKIKAEEPFYRRCAELLGCTHEYRPFPWRKRTRWNNRAAGNGRYEGYGLIRMFGPTTIHVSLHSPIRVNRWFSSPEAVYSFLENLRAI